MDNFGILPIPKYDEDQTDYISWTHGISCTMAVANNVNDPAQTGELLEGFNVLSHKYVNPAYYDVVLERKSLTDEESVEMLDEIFSNRTYDLAMYYNAKLGLVEAFKTSVNNNNNSFSSSYAKIKSKAVKQLAALVKSF